jgi:hypothetical protein
MIPSLSQFTGTWVGRRTDRLEEDFYFRILPDGRHLGFIPAARKTRRRFDRMRLWLSVASESMLFVRYRLRGPGGLRGYYRFQGDRLFFTSPPGRGSACWECTRVAAEQLPPWFEFNFAIALDRQVR